MNKDVEKYAEYTLEKLYKDIIEYNYKKDKDFLNKLITGETFYGIE